MKIREISDTEKKTGYPMFSGFEFVEDCAHVVFEITGAMAYAWNLDSVAEADIADHIEICLLETREDLRGKGLARKLLNRLKRKYKRITVFGSEADTFWRKMGFEYTDKVSVVDGISRLMEWQR